MNREKHVPSVIAIRDTPIDQADCLAASVVRSMQSFVQSGVLIAKSELDIWASDGFFVLPGGGGKIAGCFEIRNFEFDGTKYIEMGSVLSFQPGVFAKSLWPAFVAEFLKSNALYCFMVTKDEGNAEKFKTIMNGGITEFPNGFTRETHDKYYIQSTRAQVDQNPGPILESA